jgi:predicted nucleotidyltransferase
VQPLPSLDEIAAMIAARHGCHAVLLYGSRARGDAGAEVHEVYTWRGAAIDAFVVADAAVAGEPPGELMRLHDAVVLRDEHGHGRALLQRISARYERGPGAPGEVEAATLRAWVDKMVGRLTDADRVLAGFRRAELLAQLPEVYFTLRGRWWLGPKAGLAWWRAHDPAVHAAYAAALAPVADDALAAVARMVVERRTDNNTSSQESGACLPPG